MTTRHTIPVKYIFLDVVGYTKRSIEAQCYIIEALSERVKRAVNKHKISDSSLLYLPTGDGMCIALLDISSPYDIDILIAKDILYNIWLHNSRVKENWQRFEIRVGINQMDDSIVTDINGRKNVAGTGINNARRIMDLADASQILVSSRVYENLHLHKKYLHAFSKEFTTRDKHGSVLRIHQLVNAGATGLNVNPPSSLQRAPEPEPKLTKLAAYYFANSIQNEDFILDKAREDSLNHNWLKLLLWFLAKESERVSERTTYDVYDLSIMPETGYDAIDIEGQFEWFRHNVPSDIAIYLSSVTLDNALSPLPSYAYLESGTVGLVINPKGKQKLKTDWPEIWDEFGLGELSG